MMRRIITAILIVLLLSGITILTADTLRVARNPSDMTFMPSGDTSHSRVPGENRNLARLFQTRSSPVNAPESRTPPWISEKYGISLKGTAPPRMAVVTELSSGSERILHLQDTLDDGVVTDITRNRIVIRDGENEEILELPSGGTPAVTTPVKTAHILERAELAPLLNRVDLLAEEIQLTPHRDADGRLLGYRIAAMKPQGFFTRLGLKSHDLIQTVNGESITTPEQVYRILGSAAHLNRLTVAVRRGTRDVQIDFQIR